MWSDVKACQNNVGDRKITELFGQSDRASDYSVRLGEMLFDYSKTNIDAATRDALIALTEAADLAGRRDAMFSGEKINDTEGRAVLHTALRALEGDPILVDGKDVRPGVLAVLDQMADFADQVRSGAFKGQGGAITDVVNIGIGGSDLGPAMAYLALAPFADGPRCHFISNVDGADAADKLAGLNPETTLVLVASKTFTTQETMMNAQTARSWMAEKVTDPAAQFAAISTAMDHTAAFGIPAERVFGFEDWVGGRYSMWGPIGLSLMLAVGPENFREFLRGGQAMDTHFRQADPIENLPIMLALVGVWHRQVCGYDTRAVLPYDQRLSRLPAYLQQLEMESNGKSVAMDGSDVVVPSGPVVWGEPGTNGQHAFFQLIHQGTSVIPCEFIVAAQGHEADLDDHHVALLANCLAQSQALLQGRSLEEARAIMEAKGETGDELERQARHRVFPGNRPSTTLIYPKLTPFIFGQIIALYEHRVFVEGVILGINSYDQWGVELGKELAKSLLGAVGEGGDAEGADGSTRALLAYLKAARS